jgi:hypothetical protein
MPLGSFWISGSGWFDIAHHRFWTKNLLSPRPLGEGHSEGKQMNKKICCFALGAMLFAVCLPAEAQQPRKVPRIGFLHAASAVSVLTRMEAFRQGLRELGYVEGRNLIIECRGKA